MDDIPESKPEAVEVRRAPKQLAETDPAEERRRLMEQEKERLREELEAEKRELEEEEAAVQQGIEPDDEEEEHKDPALERQK